VTRLSGNRHRRGYPTTRPPTTIPLHLGVAGELLKRPLLGARSCSERERQSGARPSLTIGEESKHRRMARLRPAGQHDDVAPAAAASAQNTLSWRSPRPENEVRREACRFPPASRARCGFIDALARNARATKPFPRYVCRPGFTEARTSANKTGRVASEMIMQRLERHCGTRRTTGTPDR